MQVKKAKKISVFPKKKTNQQPEIEFIQQLKGQYQDKKDITNVHAFSDFPLSPKTLKGLKNAAYTKPTDIQRETLLLSLNGKDVLGAAQTGSGKTLAFLIPILEKLFCEQWTHLDGLGALVITPTRELAYQIFETMRKVGLYHDFSAGLIIGGKDLKFERSRMDQCNIIICTPGRLLHHMDENPLFNADSLKILVLDEADRCLDMGFKQTMNAIIANLPSTRQTLLFSATQTKSVKDLARLSLKDPSYISVHENAKYSTPSELKQNYVVCELKDKVSILWSFIKNHLKQKCIIFMSSCKQVKYIFEIFSKLRPGTSLMALYGTLHQLRRMEIYESFVKKKSAILFATDLVARGLDFPEVHWVVQVDCPEDSATYIHRVGRTARFHKGGESLLMLMPSELAMLDDLEARRIPISKIDINPTRLNNPVRKMEAYLVNTSLRESAKRAFVAYVKSVVLMKNKKVFNVDALDTDSFAHSLGLPIPPRLRFLNKINLRKKSMVDNVIKDAVSTLKISDSDSFGEQDVKIENLDVKIENLDVKIENSDVKIENLDVKTENLDNEDIEDDDDVNEVEVDYKNFNKRNDVNNRNFNLSDNDSDDEILTIKRKQHDLDIPEPLLPLFQHTQKKQPKSRAALVKKSLKKNIVHNKKIIFNETGETVLVNGKKEKKSELAIEYENENLGGIDIEKAKLVLQQEDKFDKELFKQKVKAKHKEEKRKLKMKNEKQNRDSDEFEDDEQDEVDLSWLPDPDKVYGQEEMEENSDSCKEQSANDSLKSTKRKRKGKNKNIKNTKEPPEKKHKLEKLNDSLSVSEAEKLAMMFLKK